VTRALLTALREADLIHSLSRAVCRLMTSPKLMSDCYAGANKFFLVPDKQFRIRVGKFVPTMFGRVITATGVIYDEHHTAELPYWQSYEFPLDNDSKSDLPKKLLEDMSLGEGKTSHSV